MWRHGALGCGVQIVVAVFMTMLSHFLIGYSLMVWLGAETVARWEEVNVVLQYAIAFVAGSVTVPVGLISFFAQLITDTPIF